MGYRLENKPVDLSGIKSLSYVPATKAGDVYRYRNYALRIFKDGEKTIEREVARYLTSISTDRILLPKKLLFYNNTFKGYTMKLVSQRGSSKKIVTTPKEEFLDSVECLETDIETLSQRKVLLNGISPGYTWYNGDLYLVDPSRFTVLDVGDSDDLEKINKYQLQLLLTELITSELNKLNYPSSTIRRVKEIMGLRDNDQNPSDYLYEIIGDQKDIKQFVKKIG